jgi:hypothetical protein
MLIWASLKNADTEIMAIAKELSLHVSVRGLITPDHRGVLLAMDGIIPDFNERAHHDEFGVLCSYF